jgi:chemotaxis protein methyltransferase CheR
MIESNIRDVFQAKLTNAEFKKLSEFIFKEYGIKMPDVKKTMLQSRLQKRLRALQMTTFNEYVDFVFSKKGQTDEVIHMMDVVSTNKTDFFREPVHFDFLSSHIVPEFMNSPGSRRPLKIWSAGCSSGEEPYTIAITLTELKQDFPGLDFSILGTDISTQMLQTGINGIYKESRVATIPMSLKRKYFLKSKDRVSPTVRIIPELRKKIIFQRLNFMENAYSLNDTFDIIFCRNVLIYFDQVTQENVIRKLTYRLKPNGYFFLGHSESITNFQLPLKQIKPTIFIKI